MDRSDVAKRAFGEALARLAPFVMEGALRDHLSTEAQPVLDAFSTASDDVGLREALSLAALLARRAADLGCTGSELNALTEAMVEALGDVADVFSLRGAMLEGYARALVDDGRRSVVKALAATTRPFIFAPRCVALVLQGAADADWIAQMGDALGPILLAADARSVVVIARFSEEPSDAAIAELAALVDIAAVVGASVFFSMDRSTVDPVRMKLMGAAEVFADDPSSALERALVTAKDPVRVRVADFLRRLGT